MEGELLFSPVPSIIETQDAKPLDDMPQGTPKAALLYYNNILWTCRVSTVTCDLAYASPRDLLFGLEKCWW